MVNIELQNIVDYFKELWKKLLEFFKDKSFCTNKYDDVINDLHDEEILNEGDSKFIENTKNNDNDKNDDFKNN